MQKRNTPVRGRRYKYGEEPLDVKREIKFTESQNKIIEEWQMREGVSEVGDLFRDTLLEKASRQNSERPYIRLWGEIPPQSACCYKFAQSGDMPGCPNLLTSRDPCACKRFDISSVTIVP